jgi:hypothetical protein
VRLHIERNLKQCIFIQSYADKNEKNHLFNFARAVNGEEQDLGFSTDDELRKWANINEKKVFEV